MSHHSNYNRAGAHPRSFYPSLASISSDSGQIYGATRGMGPPPLDFLPPQPVEIDVDLSISRTLPSPSTSGSNGCDSNYSHPGFGEGLYGSSNMARMQQHIPTDSQTRGPTQDPLAQWYTENDGPWVPKVIPAAVHDGPPHPRQRGNRSIVSYGSNYRQVNPSEAGSVPFGVSHSDSGYGTRRGIGNASVYSADMPERDQDCHSLAGHLENFQPYSSYNDIATMRDSRLTDSWANSPTPARSDTSLVCPTCNKPVKTQSELKKHDLRHTKPYKCNIPGCSRSQGFSTINDLERHTKSKHINAISSKKYRCNVPGCKSRDKSWPRLDNFRSHLKRVHSNQFKNQEDFDEIIRRAEFWEVPASEISHELPLPQSTPQDSPKTAGPADQDNIWKPQPAWSDTCPEVVHCPQEQMAPKSLGLDKPQEKPVAHEVDLQPQVHSPVTVQPLEVFPPPARDSGNKFTITSVLSPEAPSETASRPSPITDEPRNPHRVPEGKLAKQTEISAENEALTKALRGALLEFPPANQETARNVLPNGKLSSSTTWTSKSRLAMQSSNGETASVKDADSPPSDADSEPSEAQKKAEEIVKTIRHLGFTLKEDPDLSPRIQNLGSVAGNKSDKQVTCEVCKKFKGRPCELKKHMKRHERPYGCTFLACGKTFGSKNDWKRHENSQHFQIETWRCDGSRPEGGACSKVCYRRQSFQEHLKKEHHMSDDSEIVIEKLDTCRIGRNSQDRFWCGFCVRLVELRKKGLDAWTERFDHIDDHFMGRNGISKQGIRDWIPVDGSEKAQDTGSTLSAKNKPNGFASGSSSSGSSPDANQASATNPITRPRPMNKRRHTTEEEDGMSNKRPRADQDVIIICCQCKLQNNPSLTESCTNCSSGHSFCEECHTEYRPKEDRSPPENQEPSP